MPPVRRRYRPALSAVAPFLVAIAASVWFFRASFLHGTMPGDVLDARWSLTVFEHWFKVWSGDAAIRDLGVYHPIDTTLGLSDPFLIEGQFHSLARMVGVDPVPAWFFANFVTFLIGALGLAALSRRVLKQPVQQCVLVATGVLSYPMVVQMSHVQTFGFLWMAWIVWAIHGLLWPTGPRRARTSTIVLLVIPPLLALSSWYGLVLGATVLLVLAAVTTLLSGFRPAFAAGRRVVGTFLASFRSPVVVAAGLAGLALWGLAVWVLLPSFHLLPKTHWIDVIEFSPRWSGLLDASSGGGGIWSPLYRHYYGGPIKVGGTGMGFTPFLALFLVVAAVVALRRLIAAPRPVTVDAADEDRAGTGSSRTTFAHVLCCALTIQVMLVLLLVDERGNGLYGFLFRHIPVFASVRSPFRVQVLLYPLAMYVVLKLVEALAETRRSLRRPALVVGAVSCVIGGLVLVEMYRPSNSHWTREQVLSPKLAALVDDIKASDCEVLLMDVPPGPSFVATQVDATIVSMLSDVPTVHGYGRAPPEAHPGWVAPPAELLAWLRHKGIDGPVCLVSPRGLEIDR